MTDSKTAVRDKIGVAIRRYIDALEGKDGATLYDLAKALDGLVVTYHQTPDVEPDTTEASSARRQTKSQSSTQLLQRSLTWVGMLLWSRWMDRTKKSD
jgi:hypothetical protein